MKKCSIFNYKRTKKLSSIFFVFSSLFSATAAVVVVVVVLLLNRQLSESLLNEGGTFSRGTWRKRVKDKMCLNHALINFLSPPFNPLLPTKNFHLKLQFIFEEFKMLVDFKFKFYHILNFSTINEINSLNPYVDVLVFGLVFSCYFLNL